MPFPIAPSPSGSATHSHWHAADHTPHVTRTGHGISSSSLQLSKQSGDGSCETRVARRTNAHAHHSRLHIPYTFPATKSGAHAARAMVSRVRTTHHRTMYEIARIVLTDSTHGAAQPCSREPYRRPNSWSRRWRPIRREVGRWATRHRHTDKAAPTLIQLDGLGHTLTLAHTPSLGVVFTSLCALALVLECQLLDSLRRPVDAVEAYLHSEEQ